MFCPKCGTRSSDEVNFCSKCGYNLKSENVVHNLEDSSFVDIIHDPEGKGQQLLDKLVSRLADETGKEAIEQKKGINEKILRMIAGEEDLPGDTELLDRYYKSLLEEVMIRLKPKLSAILEKVDSLIEKTLIEPEESEKFIKKLPKKVSEKLSEKGITLALLPDKFRKK